MFDPNIDFRSAAETWAHPPSTLPNDDEFDQGFGEAKKTGHSKAIKKKASSSKKTGLSNATNRIQSFENKKSGH